MKNLLKPIALTLALTTALGVTTMSHANTTDPTAPISVTSTWDKIFPQSNKVSHQKVTFKNRYGITLVGDLYIPKNLPAGAKAPAIAVGGPFGAVKEQSSGLYAQTLAERGFITLAFDPSYTGESGGQPRNMASPDINTEDFSAAVDFLGNHASIDRERIGILGICGWGGFALNAAISDTRIKAVATSTMYDMTRIMANGYEINMQQNAQGSYDRQPAQSSDDRYNARVQMNNARWDAAKNGYATLLPANNLRSEQINADTPKFISEYANFYTTKRGFHPRAVNSNPNGSWATTSAISMVNMPILQYASEMRTPALIVHGEKAHSRYFSEDAYNALGSTNKELYIVPNASHVDLYDNQANKIPYDKFASFFKANLR